MTFENVYDDAERAAAYAALEFPGTYYLAYRDLPEIIARHTNGKRAIDFGCGTGRSTRFVKGLGFDVIGVDIARDMIALARQKDPDGDYRLVGEGELRKLDTATYDLVLSVFTFDNIPDMETKVSIFRDLGRLLNKNGRIVSLVSSPEIYTHEWASFTTRDFPENKLAKSGDKVKIIMTDVPDRRPVEDIVWSPEDYLRVYVRAGLEVVEVNKPLARSDEPIDWVNEMTIAPWTIYVLRQQ